MEGVFYLENLLSERLANELGRGLYLIVLQADFLPASRLATKTKAIARIAIRGWRHIKLQRMGRASGGRTQKASLVLAPKTLPLCGCRVGGEQEQNSGDKRLWLPHPNPNTYRDPGRRHTEHHGQIIRLALSLVFGLAVVTRCNEKSRSPKRDAVSSQVIDALEAQEIKATSMKKISTTMGKAFRKIPAQKLTIGLDLGDRSSWYCVLDESGEVVLEQRLGTTPKAMQEVIRGLAAGPHRARDRSALAAGEPLVEKDRPSYGRRKRSLTSWFRGVRLPAPDILVLAGQTFSFPVNPNQGYIDGSVYVQHAHHQVDVTSIRFGRADGNAVEMEIDLVFVFEFEGLSDYRNTPWALVNQLSNSKQLTPLSTGETSSHVFDR